MTKIKLWISDIDGTIMNYDSTYTRKMYNLIQKINSSDIKFVLATGRMFMGAEFVAKKFNIKTPIICYQGAVVRTKNEILWQAPVDNNRAKEIITYLRNKKIHTNIYNDDVLYVEDDDKRIMSQYCDGRGTTYQAINSFDDIKFGSIAKILAIIENEKIMEETKKELEEKYKGILTIVQSSPIYLEITDKNASKGNALDFLKKHWNLKDEEIIASGDQDNDIEMLKRAQYRICVGSNSKEIQKIANYHCKNVNSDELVDLIESLIQ